MSGFFDGVIFLLAIITVFIFGGFGLFMGMSIAAWLRDRFNIGINPSVRVYNNCDFTKQELNK